MHSPTSILQHAQLIHEFSRDRQFSDILQSVKDEPSLQVIAEFFGCTQPEEAILMAFVLGCGIKDSEFTLHDLIDDFGKKLNQAEQLIMIIYSLCQKNLLEADKDPADNDFLLAKFRLPEKALHAAIQQQSALLLSEKFARFQSYLQTAFQWIDQAKSQKRTAAYLQKTVLEAESANCHLPAIQQLQQLIPAFEERLILLAILEQTIRHDLKWVNLTEILPFCFPTSLQAYESLCRFRMGEWQLYQKGFILPYDENPSDEQIIRLSARAYKLLLPEITIPTDYQSSLLKIIKPEDISPESLFFEAGQQEQVSLLHKLFQPDQLASLQVALKSSGLQAGISILLHGQPGTGKTASVLQLAKLSGRAILQVEISQIRSKWLGDTEKNMRRVFSEYERACRDYAQLPVLLFNEADALFGRRLQVERSVDQVQNNLQNILLQAMEDFKGILVATTNLTKHLDPAFDRRFLYKIHFDKPTHATRLQIWKAAFPHISHQTLLDLDQQFALTGGQIRNIQRKLTIQQVVSQKQPDADCLLQWAAEELYRERSDRPAIIGFKAYRQCS